MEQLIRSASRRLDGLTGTFDSVDEQGQLQYGQSTPVRLKAEAPIFVPMTPPRSDGEAGNDERLPDDDMQWFTDWQTPDYTVCRGEREGVLGQPTRSGWLQWSLDTGTPLVDSDPSEHKAQWMEAPQLFDGEDPAEIDQGSSDERGWTENWVSIVPPQGSSYERGWTENWVSILPPQVSSDPPLNPGTAPTSPFPSSVTVLALIRCPSGCCCC